MEPSVKARILVVDDEALYVQLLRCILEQKGYEVADAPNGEEALRLLKPFAPDVVLLDVIMPVLDGFETCRRIKSDPATAPIPVLMVTSLSDRDDRLKGIAAGANDFLSKPVDAEEVSLRVSNMVYAKRLYDARQKQYEELRKLESLRDNLVHMIVHDMRNPLMAISMGLTVALKEVGAHAPSLTERLELVSDTVRDLNEMASAVLDVSRFEAGKMPLQRTPCDLLALAGKSVETMRFLAQGKGITLDVAGQPVRMPIDEELIRRVIVNLITNAIKFTPQKGTVRVAVEAAGDGARVTVTDSGYGIPPDYIDKVFDKFTQVEGREQGRKYSSGLGLTFCRLAVEAHGGEIHVRSEVEKGSEFSFTLPPA